MRLRALGLLPGATPTTPNVGAHGYNNFALAIYDFLVLYLMNTFVWRCPTARTLLPFFRRNVHSRHLDLGCGTGYYLEHGNIAPDVTVTLCDLNAACLQKATSRLARTDARCLQHDILQPLPNHEGPFDSVSMFFLLHCLPASPSRKCEVFKHLKYVLSTHGIIFGATILGPSGNHTWLSRRALRRLNYLRHFSNMSDSKEEFENALRENYEVETREVGACLLFLASTPKL